MEFPTEINNIIIDYKIQLDFIHVVEELKNYNNTKKNNLFYTNPCEHIRNMSGNTSNIVQLVRYIIYNQDMIKHINGEQQLRSLRISLRELLILLSFMEQQLEIDQDHIEYYRMLIR